MKRVLLIFLILILLVGCSKSEVENPNDSKTPDPGVGTKEPAVEKIVFTLENYPRVDGSTVTIPLSEALASRVTGLSIEEVRPHIYHQKTHQAYLNLVDNNADLIFVTYPSEDEFAYAKSKGVVLEIVPIVSEAFIFFTHVDNPVDNISLEDIRRIYTGEITNWKELGGKDVAIAPYQRPVNSGSQTGFLGLVMKELTPIEPKTEQIFAGMGDIIDAVASYQNEPDAIGYSYYYFITDMWINQNVKLLSVDGVYPTNETIAKGQYPIKTHYYAVFRGSEPKDSLVRVLVDYILSDDGQDLMEEAGYVKVR